MTERHDVPIKAITIYLDMGTIQIVPVNTANSFADIGFLASLSFPKVNPAGIPCRERCITASPIDVFYGIHHNFNRPHIVCGLAATRPFWLKRVDGTHLCENKICAKHDFILIYVILSSKLRNKTLTHVAFICESLKIDYLCKVKISRQ